MVPNHMAIDSRWVMEHPDWFIALDHSPFPTYTFNGVNLAPDERVGIYLEDHYYSRSDAAVVFKRVDHWTGSEKYIYHGNDGTSMPWNDTAQLDYLNPTVREAVIQTILHVARQFPIIRFDAAMTLAKRHYQRLWFPEPGTGGSIPSRAEHGLTAEQFNDAIPEEFWREVVDRVAQEVPDTLLLAEAFWMMEGYFVRTLGMHRVYNSAFMNMLRDEENSNYRTTMKNTLEFDPEILKRFVNFMNNPDEDTAVDQFGKGDKYFGICTLMATLPGLPMFGHGQIEGFAEKYGMEYQRAYWNEQVDPYLVERHEREIFPLLRRRYIFAEVQDFLLYDFWAPEGHVNEDVFAYSNRRGAERALVVYHNRYADASGWIRTSVGAARKTGNGAKEIVQKVLGDGLGINADAGWFTIFRDNVTGLEYIRHSQELCEKGLFVELKAYESHVLLDFREVQDNAAHHYEQVAARLNGRGVPSMEIALLELILQPLHEKFRQMASPNILRHLATQAIKNMQPPVAKTFMAAHKPVLDEMQENAVVLLKTINQFTGHKGDAEPIAQAIREGVEAVLGLPELAQGKVSVYLRSQLDTVATWMPLLSWAVVKDIGKLAGTGKYQEQSLTWLDELLLAHVLTAILQEAGLDAQQAQQAVHTVKMLTVYADLFTVNEPAAINERLTDLFLNHDAPQVLGVNQFKGATWFNKELFEQALWYLFATNLITDKLNAAPGLADKTQATYQLIQELQQQAETAGYQAEKFLKVLQPETASLEGETTKIAVSAENDEPSQKPARLEAKDEVTA
ncbi:MAG: hypothetical protein JOZ57_11545, partial [Abitibacteriaceae bacterium]|nr:hypothetical protein [Abditibacteriaceae bacterium]